MYGFSFYCGEGVKQWNTKKEIYEICLIFHRIDECECIPQNNFHFDHNFFVSAFFLSFSVSLSICFLNHAISSMNRPLIYFSN